MRTDDSVIIFGFPGTGKTYAFEHAEELGLDLQDSDSSHFHWLYKDNEFKEPVLDEDGKKVVHPEWPANYAAYISLTGREQAIKPDYIFVSTHDEVMKAIGSLGFTSFTVVPDNSLKEVYLELYRKRGSDEAFIQMMDKNWDKFIDSVVSNCINSEDFCNMLVLLRKGGKIQSIYDLIKNRIGLGEPMQFFRPGDPGLIDAEYDAHLAYEEEDDIVNSIINIINGEEVDPPATDD